MHGEGVEDARKVGGVQAAGLQPGEEGPDPGVVGAPGVAVQGARSSAAA